MSLKGVKLKRVNDTEDAAEFLRWLGESRPVLAVDTETTGLEWHKPGFTRLIQFGDGACGWTIGMHLWAGLAHEALARYDGPIVAHNAKFDMHAIDVAGLPLPKRHQWDDTFLMHALLYPLEFHGLKPVSAKLLDKGANAPSKRLDSLMKEKHWTWATVPYDCLGYSVYGALDTVLCARLYEILKPQIDARFPAAYEREMATSHIMFETERRGLRVDLAYTERLHARYSEEMADLLTKIQFYGVQNPNSRPQIEKALRLEAWEPSEFTDAGAPSLKKQVLQGIEHELAGLILEYRWREKYSSYTEKILRTHSNGILFPSINTFEAKTGRMSIGSDKKERGTNEIVSVPWQQIPHTYDVRRCVLPRHEGEVLRPADYDSQELRVLAHYSGAQGLIDAINSGQDMHVYTAERIYGGTIEKSDPRRQIAKMARYLQVYGGGADKLAAAVGITVQEAEHFKLLDEQAFPEIKQFMSGVIYTGRSRAQREGRAYIETWGGRQCEADPDFAYKLCNYIIQGSCADLLKEKLIALDSAGFTGFIDLPVHDELVMSVPNDAEGDDIAHEIKNMMEEHHAFRVPLTVELSDPVQSWGHKYLKPGQVGWDEIQTAEEAA